MAYIQREDKAEPIFDIGIYVIIFEHDESFYISKAKMESLRESYRSHYYLKISQTRECFEMVRSGADTAKMYLLNEVRTSQRLAFRYCLAWIRYFKEHDYKSLCTDKMNVYAEDLKDDALEIYESIKDKPLSEVCPCGEELFTDIGQKKRDKTGSADRINFRVNDADYEKIKKRAEEANMSISAYCKQKALTGTVNHIGLEEFEEMSNCIKMFEAQNRKLKQFLEEIRRTGKYYKADINVIQKAINENSIQQEKMYKQLRETLKKYF